MHPCCAARVSLLTHACRLPPAHMNAVLPLSDMMECRLAEEQPRPNVSFSPLHERVPVAGPVHAAPLGRPGPLTYLGLLCRGGQ